MSKATIEDWRLVAICDRCGSHTLLFRNVPERLSHIQGTYATTCPNCGRNGSFSIGRVAEEEGVEQSSDCSN